MSGTHKPPLSLNLSEDTDRVRKNPFPEFGRSPHG